MGRQARPLRSRLGALVVGLSAGAALIAGAATAEIAIEDLPTPDVTTFTLDNGMEIVVIEDHRAPVVTHMVWYRVGSADEPQGESGVAHFLEHLMFKGTDDVPPTRFSEIVAEYGGQDNAFTSYDYTAYHQRVGVEWLEVMMRLEADRMRDLRLTPELVAPERDVVLEERSQRTDNSPEGLFYEQLNAALYLNHGYGRPVIGWRSEIEALDMDAALRFYERFYAPDNAVLVVAGDVDPAQVRQLAEIHYGPLEPSGVVAYQRPTEPPHLAARRVVMTDPRVGQNFVIRAYVAPSFVTAEPGAAEAYSVAADILGGGLAARLYEQLVVEERVAISAGSFYSGVARDEGSFTVYAVPASGVTLAEVETRMDAVIAEFAAEGPTEAELARAKTGLIASAIYQLDSVSSMARTYGAAITIGLDADDVSEWPARIAAVEAEDVVAAIRSLRVEASVTGWLSAEPQPLVVGIEGESQ